MFTFYLKGHHSERSKKLVSILATVRLNLPGEFTNPASHGLCTMNLEISLTPAENLTVQYLYRTIISKRNSARTAESNQCTVRLSTVQYKYSTVQVLYRYGPGTVPYCYQLSQGDFHAVITQIFPEIAAQLCQYSVTVR
jgi:hypothetical protein